ncbi:MAG: hypothetical protein ACM3TR_15465 [Caulobacteraceae bacterium]
MEGLLAAIFVIIGIVNLIVKSQKDYKGNTGGKRSVQKKAPMQKYKYNTPAPTLSRTTEADLDREGTEMENRSRTGSLEYKEQVYTTEGLVSEADAQMAKGSDIKADAGNKDIMDAGEAAWGYGISMDDMQRSVVMAEIMGPPRAFKRNIR